MAGPVAPLRKPRRLQFNISNPALAQAILDAKTANQAAIADLHLVRDGTQEERGARGGRGGGGRLAQL